MELNEWVRNNQSIKVKRCDNGFIVEYAVADKFSVKEKVRAEMTVESLLEFVREYFAEKE